MDSQAWYIRQLAHQTRKWNVSWAGQALAITQFLESAWKKPRNPEFWTDTTWEIVRQALRWHCRLRDQLQYWQWPACQEWWCNHNGPTWDPYDWIIACSNHSPMNWRENFDQILHHPQVHPGLATWAWAIWKEEPNVQSFLDMTPLQVIDTALHACTPPVGNDSWARAWYEWVKDSVPHEGIRLSPPCYPTSVVEQWEKAIASYPELTLSKVPYHTEQIRFF